MTQAVVTVGTTLVPVSVQINAGDIVIWVNNTAVVQTISSNDGGQTFTTGPVQPGANSLPITVPTNIGYAVSPAGFNGTVTVSASTSTRSA